MHKHAEHPIRNPFLKDKQKSPLSLTNQQLDLISVVPCYFHYQLIYQLRPAVESPGSVLQPGSVSEEELQEAKSYCL